MASKPAAFTVFVCVAIAGVATLSAQQSPRSGRAFDVASVKRFVPSPDRRQTGAISIMPGGRFTAPSATLRALITVAYGVLDIQIADDGDRLPGERYEIEARTRPDVTADEARAMLRSLLTDRFGLIARRETRELPVYVLTMARADRRLGSQMRPTQAECRPPQGPPNVKAPPPPPPPAPGGDDNRGLVLNGGSTRCLSLRMTTTYGDHWSFREVTMPILVERFVTMLGRPVVDRTQLEGPFDVDLTYSADNPVVDTSGAPNAPSFTTAVREQLGLRLESTRERVEVLVIDAVAPPSEN